MIKMTKRNIIAIATTAGAFSMGLIACSPAGSAADDPANAKDCIFTLAATLPHTPGMVVKTATATSEPIPANAIYGLKESWKVSLDVEAVGRQATYSGQCGYTSDGHFAYAPYALKIVR
jgi:hypothetical protein